MGQLLVIVSKDKPQLCEYLRRSYALQDGVRVLVDRRANTTDEVDSLTVERRHESSANAEVIFREVGARPKPAPSSLHLMFADRDWTRRGSLRLRTEGAALPWPGLAP